MKQIFGALLIMPLMVYVNSCNRQEPSIGSTPTLKVDITDSSYDVLYHNCIFCKIRMI